MRLDPLTFIVLDRRTRDSRAYIVQDGWQEAIIIHRGNEIYTIAKNKKKMYFSKRVVEDGHLREVIRDEVYMRFYHRARFRELKRAIWSSNDFSPQLDWAIKEIIMLVEGRVRFLSTNNVLAKTGVTLREVDKIL